MLSCVPVPSPEYEIRSAPEGSWPPGSKHMGAPISRSALLSTHPRRRRLHVDPHKKEDFQAYTCSVESQDTKSLGIESQAGLPTDKPRLSARVPEKRLHLGAVESP